MFTQTNILFQPERVRQIPPLPYEAWIEIEVFDASTPVVIFIEYIHSPPILSICRQEINDLNRKIHVRLSEH